VWGTSSPDYRVSTDKQGIDGYGIGAQKKAVEERLDGGGWQLTASFTEVESGRRKSRPELEKPLAACKRHKAKLIVARLDRLTRDTQFLLTLLNSGTEVIFCDLPQIPGAMGRMIVTMMAAIAEFEAGFGERTKAGLKEAKRQGKTWGGTNPKSLQIKQEAMERAEALRPLLTEMADLPALTVASELNRLKVKTPAGGKWHVVQVIRVSASGSPGRRREHGRETDDGAVLLFHGLTSAGRGSEYCTDTAIVGFKWNGDVALPPGKCTPDRTPAR
jgi:DNA invertase Pin-like site-specific DNA recombinase